MSISTEIKLDGLIPLFVCKEGYSKLKEAATVGDFTYASDAHILIKIPNIHLDNYFSPKKNTPDFEHVIPKSRIEKPITVLMAETLEVLSSVPMVTGTMKCRRCDGDGENECDLGHMHECERCKGEGEVNSNSVPKVYSENEFIRIGESIFNAGYVDVLTKVMKECDMDHCLLVSSEKTKGHLFQLSMCEVVLMPCIEPEEGHYKVHTLIP